MSIKRHSSMIRQRPDEKAGSKVNQKEFQAEERRIIMIFMMAVGGMMGAYTYVMRGGVFCNAQTGNLLMMGISLGNGQLSKALYYLIPFAAYLAGTIVSEMLRESGIKTFSLKWNTCFTGLELLILFLIGWIPVSAPNQIVQVIINFLASIQYNSFRKAEGVPMATTFCTNHVRQIGIWLVDWKKNGSDESKKRILIHAIMLSGFLSGVMLITSLSSVFQEKVIWLAIMPLMFVFSVLLAEDIRLAHQDNSEQNALAFISKADSEETFGSGSFKANLNSDSGHPALKAGRPGKFFSLLNSHLSLHGHS